MDEVFDLQKLRMKTLNIAIPELIYDELYRRGMIRRINEMVINYLLDVLNDIETRNKSFQESNDVDRFKKR